MDGKIIQEPVGSVRMSKLYTINRTEGTFTIPTNFVPQILLATAKDSSVTHVLSSVCMNPEENVYFPEGGSFADSGHLGKRLCPVAVSFFRFLFYNNITRLTLKGVA